MGIPTMGTQIYSLTREEELAVTSSANGNLNGLEAYKIQEVQGRSDPRQSVGLFSFPPRLQFQVGLPVWLVYYPWSLWQAGPGASRDIALGIGGLCPGQRCRASSACWSREGLAGLD